MWAGIDQKHKSPSDTNLITRSFDARRKPLCRTLSKLASPDEIIKAINRVLAGQIYVSELVNSQILSRLGNNHNAESPSNITTLSDREIEVFQLIGGGLNSRECATSLKLGTSTVDSYRARIKDKLGIKNAAELYQRSAQWLVENQL